MDGTLDSILRIRSDLHSERIPFERSNSSYKNYPPVSSKAKLYAIADLHLGHKLNTEAWAALQSHSEDGLIIAGDVGESPEHLRLAFTKANECFAHVFWVPGNHELYTMPGENHKDDPRGEAKYQQCVEIAREHNVLTPEDPFMKWEGDGGPAIIALVFTLYDYSFRPAYVTREGALDWAREDRGTEATDEALLHPDPRETRDEWCHARTDETEMRLQMAREANQGVPLVIVNHWPLREDLITIPLAPRFTLWCGTTKTKEWHKEYNAKVVVTGHLHVRRTDWIDGVRFEECSLGYPRQWDGARDQGKDVNMMLREILPGPPPPGTGEQKTIWRRYG